LAVLPPRNRVARRAALAAADALAPRQVSAEEVEFSLYEELLELRSSGLLKAKAIRRQVEIRRALGLARV
jgi:hypothetical protein